MDSQENKYFNWTEPTLIIKRSLNDQTSYLLYNSISNFKINDDAFKLVTIELPKKKSNYIDYINNYRDEYIIYLETLYPESYKLDMGFNALLNSIRSKNESLIMIHKNYTLIGATSYSISDKQKNIDISHIGVIERRMGYGTLIMKEIFKLAKIINYSVSATSNGYSDDFYHSLGMIRIVDKPLGIYTIQAKYIGEL